MQYSLKNVFNFIKFGDIAHLLLVMFILPFALIAKIFIRDFWLVCEDRNEARDNGYWLFRWVRENHPKQRIAYAINKKSPDYDKVKPLGKVINYGTLSHWFWYIVADKNISSQKGGKPNAAVCYLFEVVFKMRKNNRVFLQHGITINKGDWLFYKNTYMRLFITAAQPEYEFILSDFGYPKENVALCGFTRFDPLFEAKTDKNMILVMPTWRNWLGRESKENRNIDFGETEYCKQWNAFLNSSILDELLKTYDKTLLFYPHRNMQKFLKYFSTKSDYIEIADWKKYDIQELLKKAALMITDYSSVFFDFAYMRKPVIFYQFDEEQFRAKQYGQGYFDYKNSVLGKWTDNIDDLLSIFECELVSGMNKMSDDAIRQFFPLYDNENCRRNYEEIKKLK